MVPITIIVEYLMPLGRNSKGLIPLAVIMMLILREVTIADKAMYHTINLNYYEE